MEEIYTRYKRWRYKNTTLLILSVVLVVYIVGTDVGKQAVASIDQLGYLGIFLSGMFFVSTFTVAPAGIVLFSLAELHHPVVVGILAGLGGVTGDYIIFRFLKDGVLEELKPLFGEMSGSHISKIFQTPYFAWFAPVLGALIVISPLPDEIGVGLMGLSRLKHWQFLGISLVLNSFGMFLIGLAAHA